MLLTVVRTGAILEVEEEEDEDKSELATELVETRASGTVEGVCVAPGSKFASLAAGRIAVIGIVGGGAVSEVIGTEPGLISL